MNCDWLRAVTELIFVRDEPEPADVILVPGSGNPELAQHAAELYRAGWAPLVLPSGKYAKHTGRMVFSRADVAAAYPGAWESEWAFLREVLRRSGVPDEAILREDQATYTWENAKFSRAALLRRGALPKTAILCCKPWHARRSLSYYQLALPETRLLCCPCPWPGSDRDDWTTTAEGRERVLGEIERCGHQLGNEVLAALDGRLDIGPAAF